MTTSELVADAWAVFKSTGHPGSDEISFRAGVLVGVELARQWMAEPQKAEPGVDEPMVEKVK